MVRRFDVRQLQPEYFKSAFELDRMIANGGLDRELLHLVKIRASQINGCAHCLKSHIKEAVIDHVDMDKINMLPVWSETETYAADIRIALEWTEALTCLNRNQDDLDAIHQKLAAYFDENEILQLTYAIAMINFWNRLNIGAKT
ncbi:carboxymuconolactone decarboxylase family protein [Bartonella sp. LJL80]